MAGVINHLKHMIFGFVESETMAGPGLLRGVDEPRQCSPLDCLLGATDLVVKYAAELTRELLNLLVGRVVSVANVPPTWRTDSSFALTVIYGPGYRIAHGSSLSTFPIGRDGLEGSSLSLFAIRNPPFDQSLAHASARCIKTKRSPFFLRCHHGSTIYESL